MKSSKNIVFLGMMGSGKTSIGFLVSKKLKLDFYDVDNYIEKKLDMKISEIFQTKGEIFFRKEEEKEVLKSLKKQNCVIALGGGAFVNSKIRDNILKNTISVWLDVDINILEKRVKWNENRPLLKKKNNYEMIKKIYQERKKIYKLANHKIKCDKMDKSDLVKKIISLYE